VLEAVASQLKSDYEWNSMTKSDSVTQPIKIVLERRSSKAERMGRLTYMKDDWVAVAEFFPKVPEGKNHSTFQG